MHADIRIASPCKADWNRMAGDDRVRHCAACNLNVYNFAAMTSAEAEELLSNREGRLCLRLYQRRDGTVLTNDCPIGFQVRIRHISRIAGAALAGAMTVVSAVAQTLPNNPPAATQPKQGNLKVALSDASGAVISNAQIRLSDSSGHERFSGKTRDNGVLQTNLPVGEYRLDITSPGFQNFHQTLTISQDELVMIHLQIDMTIVQGGDMFGEAQPMVEPEPSNLSVTHVEPKLNITPLAPLQQKRSNKK